MKRPASLFCLAAALLAAGCTSSQFSYVATGSSLGGMFGSSIGGILGGHRGHDVGTAIGMIAGGALGAAASANRSDRGDAEQMDVAAGYDDYRQSRTSATEYYSPWSYLEVTNLRLVDANGNNRLDAGERVAVTMDIYNRSDYTMHDIAPQITCDNRRVVISPTAIVSQLGPGRGFRYKVEIIAPRRLRRDVVSFTVSFGEKRHRVTAKTFSLRCGH